MVPASRIRDLLLAEVITPLQACNMPTCRLSKERDNKLREAGWASKTPDIYNFWKRYEYSFDITDVFETYDGTEVDTNMSLDDHLNHFSG